jgi:hypothetical protein
MFISQYLCIEVRLWGLAFSKKLIAKAGLTNEEYIELFYRRGSD